MGIDAYLHKTSSAEELVAAIDAVVGRDPALGNVVVSMPRSLLQRVGGETASGLSERETEVVVLAARGLSNRLIAKELHISDATVKRHLANAYEKVGVRSRTEVVRKALMEQWIGIHEIVSADGDGSSDGSGG
jgi:DNA-binding NarL/FixJ family response regulator